MASKKCPTTRPSLSEVKEQFKIWRRTRKSPRPIPDQLWQAAVSLTATNSISQISKKDTDVGRRPLTMPIVKNYTLNYQRTKAVSNLTK